MWIFDKASRDEAVALWVDAQKATGHPKAVANADFVGKAIIDFLDSSPSLMKAIPKSPEIKPERRPSVDLAESAKRSEDTTKQKDPDESPSFNIQSMLDEWHNM